MTTSSGRSTHIARDSLTNLEQKLDPQEFVRVHRSAIVQLRSVKTITSWFGGDQLLHLNSGAEVRLSRNFRREFERRLQHEG